MKKLICLFACFAIVVGFCKNATMECVIESFHLAIGLYLNNLLVRQNFLSLIPPHHLQSVLAERR